MNSDTPMILDVLRAFDIRVARTAAVDSAEAAVAFAERRNAPDPRFMPILLFDALHPVSAQEWQPLDSIDAVRSTYGRMAAAGTHVIAQEAVESGETVTIGGETRAAGRIISLASRMHVVEHAVPLSASDAEGMASTYEGFGHRGKREMQMRMIAHLLERVARFLDEESDVKHLQLNVRLHENGYTVVDAMCTPPPKRLHERLGRHAHDVWEYGYRP